VLNTRRVRSVLVRVRRCPEGHNTLWVEKCFGPAQHTNAIAAIKAYQRAKLQEEEAAAAEAESQATGK
jgi:hypothetical protein